uniref:CD109 antigen-like isoform X2 n=1 Tax=Myxine glutinosa TaxID=7769 RepID=UPI00358EA267
MDYLRQIFLLSAVIWAVILQTSAESEGLQYLILAPTYVRSNRPYSIVFVLSSKEPLNVVVRGEIVKVEDGRRTILDSTNVSFSAGGIRHLNLVMPELDRSKMWMPLRLLVSVEQDGNQLVLKESPLRFIDERFSIVIQKDRTFYTPGQTIRLYALPFQNSSHLSRMPMKVSLNVANTFKLKEWNFTEQKYGLISLDIPLSDGFPTGQCSLDTTANEGRQRSYFYVSSDGDVDPRVNIDFPSYFALNSTDELTGTVSVRYRGHPVKGKMTVTLSFRGKRVAMDNISISNLATVTIPQEKLDKLPLRQFFQLSRRMFVSDTNIVSLDIAVQISSEQTGIAVQNSTTVLLTESKVKISFDADQRDFIPGLNCTLTYSVSLQDDSLLPEENSKGRFRVWVRQYNSTRMEFRESDCYTLDKVHHETHFEYDLPASGLVKINFPTLRNVSVIFVEVQYGNVSSCATLRRTSSEAILQYSIATDYLKVGVPTVVKIETLEPLNEVFYSIMTEEGVLLSVEVSGLQFTLTPSIEWEPIANILVLGIRSDGAVASFLQGFMVHSKEGHATWSKPTAKPGERVTLEVSNLEPESYVAVQVIKKEDYRYSSIPQEPMKRAVRIHDERKYIPSTFSKNNLNVITNLPLLPSVPARYMFPPNFINLPSHGSSWIWANSISRSDGRVVFTATTPNELTTWKAFIFIVSKTLKYQILMQNPELTVSSPIFVSANVPDVVLRGEEFIISVYVYNYKPMDIEAVITLEDEAKALDMPFSLPGMADNKKRVLVSSQATADVQFAVSPRVLGRISITVHASHDNDQHSATYHTVVQPEGIPREYSQSILLDPDDVHTMHFNLPANMVPDSNSSFIVVSGNYMAPSINGLDNLLQMSYGCGEQNMIRFAPNVYITIYLKSIAQLTPELEKKTEKLIFEGYQRELEFFRRDSSFSAFGNRDPHGSTWLTAFVLKCFLSARDIIPMDPENYEKIISYLLKKQLPEGNFAESGRVINRNLQGGSAAPVTITAYVLSALLESNMEDTLLNVHSARILKSVQFLESKVMQGNSSSYTLAITTYALALANSNVAPTALNKLDEKSIHKGGLRYWETHVPSLSHSFKPTSLDIETTAYALLAHIKLGHIEKSIPIIKWLAQQRNHLGGFSSTQDTVVALQALAASAQADPVDVQLNVDISTSQSKVLHVTGTNATESHRIEFPTSPSMTLNFTSTGTGTVYIQWNILYNVRDDLSTGSSDRKRRSTEKLGLHVVLNETMEFDGKIHLTSCASWLNDDLSGMLLMEVNLPSGFITDEQSIKLHHNIMKTELEGSKVTLYLVEVGKHDVCANILAYQVALVANISKPLVKLIDYYEPHRRVEILYEAPRLSKMSLSSFCGVDGKDCQSNVKGRATHQQAVSSTVLFAFAFFLSLVSRNLI